LLALFYGRRRLAGQQSQVANVHIRISKRAKIK
jgi:hypothetical protein